VTSPIKYLSEVRVELSRITWPKRDEVIRLTALVIAVSVIVSVYTGGLDVLFTKLIEFLISR
jgi:preprotein translocase subunit SecE